VRSGERSGGSRREILVYACPCAALCQAPHLHGLLAKTAARPRAAGENRWPMVQEVTDPDPRQRRVSDSGGPRRRTGVVIGSN
jgi:hypothetical protein